MLPTNISQAHIHLLLCVRLCRSMEVVDSKDNGHAAAAAAAEGGDNQWKVMMMVGDTSRETLPLPGPPHLAMVLALLQSPCP